MKKILLYLIFIFSSTAAIAGGGGTGPTTAPAACNTGTQFCNDNSTTFPSLTGVPSLGGGGIYGCLGSTPNPSWYYVTVQTPGSLAVTITQTNSAGNAIDGDAIMWGPFASLAAGCASLSTTNDVDCSYSTSNTETMNASNVLPGQVYIILATNFNGSAGSITLSSNGSAGISCGCTVMAGNNGPICPGATANLTASTVAGASSYTWTGPNGFTSNQQNPTNVPIPSAPGSYSYEVTVVGGSGAPCTSITTVVVIDPQVDAGLDQTVCAGDPVTLSGALATTYAWDNGVTDAVAFVPVSSGVYTVTGSTNGCTATDQVLVTVTPLPIVNAGTDVQLCTGFSVVLTGTGSGLSWDNGITDGVSFVPVATATYTLTSTVNGCSSTDDVEVTVNALPIANAGPDQAVCLGFSVNLNSTGPNPTWTGGITNGLAFTPNVTATYTLTVVDANLCTSSDDVLVTVNLYPVIDAGPDLTVCSGTSVSLSGSGGTSYTWNNGVFNGISFVPAVGTITYTATDNNPTGCSGSDQVTVTVNPLPIVDAGNDTLICSGFSVNLSGEGAVSYVWDNSVINGIFFTPISTATYNVVGTDANGCVNTDQVIVAVTPTPIVSFVPSVTSGCVPVVVTYTNTNPTLNTYSWNLGNGVTSTNPNTVTTTYTGVSCYDVTLVSTTPNGCVGQTTISSIVCANDNPVAAFTADPNVLSLIDTYAQLMNETTGAETYVWNFGDGTGTSTEINPVHSFPSVEPGSYQISLIAYSVFGCTDTALVNIEVQDAVIYYVPNSFTPGDDEYNPMFKPVFTSGFDPYDYKMIIFNRWGEIIFETRDASYGWDGTYLGSAGLCKEGDYIWQIEFKTTLSDERKKITGSVTLLK
jgi:gliding motility-associated-like protein